MADEKPKTTPKKTKFVNTGWGVLIFFALVFTPIFICCKLAGDNAFERLNQPSTLHGKNHLVFSLVAHDVMSFISDEVITGEVSSVRKFQIINAGTGSVVVTSSPKILPGIVPATQGDLFKQVWVAEATFSEGETYQLRMPDYSTVRFELHSAGQVSVTSQRSNQHLDFGMVNIQLEQMIGISLGLLVGLIIGLSYLAIGLRFGSKNTE
jgi:hypothetical protein